MRLGSLKQLLDKNGWNYLQDLTDSYPGIVKLTGPLGVCFAPLNSLFTFLMVVPFRQHRMLYVWDPAALHSILVKDQYVYEEAAWYTK